MYIENQMKDYLNHFDSTIAGVAKQTSYSLISMDVLKENENRMTT